MRHSFDMSIITITLWQVRFLVLVPVTPQDAVQGPQDCHGSTLVFIFRRSSTLKTQNSSSSVSFCVNRLRGKEKVGGPEKASQHVYIFWFFNNLQFYCKLNNTWELMYFLHYKGYIGNYITNNFEYPIKAKSFWYAKWKVFRPSLSVSVRNAACMEHFSFHAILKGTFKINTADQRKTPFVYLG